MKKANSSFYSIFDCSFKQKIENHLKILSWSGEAFLCHFFIALNHHCYWMLIQSYKLLLVFTLGLMKEMHISGQQIKYITAYRNSSEPSMHCIQMRPAGTRDKKNLISYTQKKMHTEKRVKTKKRYKVSLFLYCENVAGLQFICLYESKVMLYNRKERFYFSFYKNTE